MYSRNSQVNSFIFAVQISRKQSSKYTPKYRRLAALACVYKGQSLLENVPLPQCSLKYFQLGRFSALLSFYNLARSDTFLQCICRFHLLLLSLMSVHLINLTVAFIPHPFFSFASTKKVFRKKMLTDSRGH